MPRVRHLAFTCKEPIKSFQKEDPVPWHFGLEMSRERIEALKPLLEEMRVELHEGVPDGRPVDQFIHTPEGHRIDLAPFWPTKPGESRRPAAAEESAAAG